MQVKLKVTTRHYGNKNSSKIKYGDGIKERNGAELTQSNVSPVLERGDAYSTPPPSYEAAYGQMLQTT